MRVRLETDLTWGGTHLIDADTGQELPNAHHISLFGSDHLGRFICRVAFYHGREEAWTLERMNAQDVELVGLTLTTAADQRPGGGGWDDDPSVV